MLAALALPALFSVAGIGPLEACQDAVATLRSDAAEVCEQIAAHQRVSRRKRLRARELLVLAHSRAGDVDLGLEQAIERLVLDPIPIDDEALDEQALALFARAQAQVDATPPVTVTHPPAGASIEGSPPTVAFIIDDRVGLVSRAELWVRAQTQDGLELVARHALALDDGKVSGALHSPLPPSTPHQLSYRLALLTHDGLVLETDRAKVIVELGEQRAPAPEVKKAPVPWQVSLAGDVALTSTVLASLGVTLGAVGAVVALGASVPLLTGEKVPAGLLGTGAAGAAGGMLVAVLGAAGLGAAWGLRAWGEQEG